MFPCASLTNTDDPNPFQGSKKRNSCCEHLALARRRADEKIHICHKCASIRTKTLSLGCSVVGWAWQHQNFTKWQEQINLLLLRAKGPARPRMRAENAERCNPDHWEMDFDL